MENKKEKLEISKTHLHPLGGKVEAITTPKGRQKRSEHKTPKNGKLIWGVSGHRRQKFSETWPTSG